MSEARALPKLQTSASDAPLDPKLRIRPYEPRDDEGCKRLEVVASQFQAFRGLVKSAVVHYGPFDAKALQFQKSLLLVVTDDDLPGAVVAVIAVAVKRAWLQGAFRNVGYVFDLRVDESHQRRGIAMHLSREAERRISLAPYCVEYLYLSVNADNAKAKALYTKLGWSACSGRELSFSLLSQPASLADRAAKAALSSAVRMADASEAARLTANAYADRDLSLAPDELARALFHSELYLGTYQCSDGRGSSAALSLWHGSAFTGFRPIRLLVPFDWALRFFWWARTRTHFRARAFAAVHEGPAWEPLMAAVYARVHDEARRLGFALLVTNTDQHDPVNRALKPGPRKAAAVPASISRPSSGDGLPTSGDKAEAEALLGTGGPTNDGKPAKKPRTEFWHKALSPALLRDGGLPCLAPDAFFDPRDF